METKCVDLASVFKFSKVAARLMIFRRFPSLFWPLLSPLFLGSLFSYFDLKLQLFV